MVVKEIRIFYFKQVLTLLNPASNRGYCISITKTTERWFLLCYTSCMENLQFNSQESKRDSSKTLLIILLVLTSIALGYFIGRSQNVAPVYQANVVDEQVVQENNDPVVSHAPEDNIYSALGFSLVLPEGVTAGNIQQAEGGPYQSVTFSDGTVVNYTTNLDFDNQYGTFPFTAPTETIGDNTFFVSHAMGGRAIYGIELNGKRYQISQDSQRQIDLSTFSVL